MKIFKYPLELTEEQTITLPEPAWILSVINQYGKLVLYAVAELKNNEINLLTVHSKTIKIVGTGEEFPDIDIYEFINTVSMDDGRLIWHVFVKMMENPYA